jgi:hypothetical protein
LLDSSQEDEDFLKSVVEAENILGSESIEAFNEAADE